MGIVLWGWWCEYIMMVLGLGMGMVVWNGDVGGP